MFTKEKMLWSFIKLSQIISKEMYEYEGEEFVCVYCGLKVDGPITDCSSRYFCRFFLTCQFRPLRCHLLRNHSSNRSQGNGRMIGW